VVEDDRHTKGRLRARPVGYSTGAHADVAPAGLRPLGVSTARGGYLYIPAIYQAGYHTPLVLLLHGAGEDARDGLALLRQQADTAGLLLLALTSRGPTWDIISGRGRYGSDVASIDQALQSTFSHYAVDPARIAVGGYSDGASYALSLGITNGDLFTHVLAFSPGFMIPAAERFPAHLRLARNARWLAPDRPLQPQNRPAARTRWLRSAVPRVRGWPRGSA
jgi:phospholipase/carboxylesterase